MNINLNSKLFSWYMIFIMSLANVIRKVYNH
jgi:hypothetical protein